MKNDTRTHQMTVQEEFKRQVIFLADSDKILAIFPFNHDITDQEYDMLLESYYDKTEDDYEPTKNDFCLMFELEFGWGWILKSMITDLEVAEIEDYLITAGSLIGTKIIKNSFILNEDYNG